MRCFLCRSPLVSSAFSVMTHFQPKEDVDDRGRAHFCDSCTERLDAAIDDYRVPAGPRLNPWSDK